MDQKPHDYSNDARQAILAAALRHVPFEGWTDRALSRAVADTDLPQGAAALYFPGGAPELLRFWIDDINNGVRAKIEAMDWSGVKIRDRITQSVLIWLEAFKTHDAALRRSAARLSLPDRPGQAPKQIWDTADMIWRAIGDTSTDGNYYSKRLILSGVLGSTLLSWMQDTSPDKDNARAFLDRRIDNVMKFETAKWKLREQRKNWPDPAQILGRLRYGSARRRRRY